MVIFVQRIKQITLAARLVRYQGNILNEILCFDKFCFLLLNLPYCVEMKYVGHSDVLHTVNENEVIIEARNLYLTLI